MTGKINRENKNMNILLENVLKNNVMNLEKLLSSGHNPDTSDENGYSLLHWACQEGFTEVIKVLRKYNANMNIVDINGITPLFNSSGSEDTKIVNLLLYLGAGVNYSTQLGSALHNACAYEDNEIINILLENNIDIHITDEDGLTSADMTDNINIKNKILNFSDRLGSLK